MQALESEADILDDVSQGNRQISLRGPLTVATAGKLSPRLLRLEAHHGENIRLSLASVSQLDTAGAWLVSRTVHELRAAGAIVELPDCTATQRNLIDTVTPEETPLDMRPARRHPLVRPIAELGEATVNVAHEFSRLLAFLGLTVLRFGRQIVQPRRIRWNALVNQLEHVGFKALPIVGLMSFLIGIVLVQQGAVQLKQFGAEIYVVDIVGIGTLRELGILLTAIMVAGRSGSAFTAQIGSMRLQEEVDAMEAIGLDPMDVLVIPRVLALVILMPLLGFYASMMALIGGAIFTWLQLDIPIATFAQRLQEAVTFDHFLIGMIKAPVFGLVIAVVGCFEGMQVEGGAQSVGEHTTRSVVVSIFMVIVLDAIFAIFFTSIGW
jgi:phospholipid/cholesterol/gamma-HCH transport system permease protein